MSVYRGKNGDLEEVASSEEEEKSQSVLPDHRACITPSLTFALEKRFHPDVLVSSTLRVLTRGTICSNIQVSIYLLSFTQRIHFSKPVDLHSTVYCIV